MGTFDPNNSADCKVVREVLDRLDEPVNTEQATPFPEPEVKPEPRVVRENWGARE